MKINFIIPPQPFLGDSKRNVPLGVMYLASVVRRKGYDTTIVDLRDKTVEESIPLIPKSDIHGFTSTTPDYPYCEEIAKRLDPKSYKIIGGIHPTACSLKIDRVFDVVCVGEGERTILNVIDDLKRKNNYLLPIRVDRFYKSDQIEDLSSIPFPARYLLPNSSFISHDLVDRNKAATTIITSRGCLYNCSFCASKEMWGRSLRHRTVDNVIKEIIELKEQYGIEQLRFQDDGITYNKEWLYEFCAKIKPLKVTWRANARIDSASKIILSCMKKAGCVDLAYGVESTEQRVLDKCNKAFKIEQAYQSLKNAKEVGIKTRVLLLIGLPGQDENVSKNMINFIKDTKPSGVDLSTFVPFPGSDIYKHPEKYGIKLRSDVGFEDYVMTRGLYGNEKESDFIFEHDILSNEQLKKHREIVLNFIQTYNLEKNK